jgi:hypothetical protein
MVSQYDSHVGVGIGEATKADSAAMKAISILGLTFLPGTLVCVGVFDQRTLYVEQQFLGARIG